MGSGKKAMQWPATQRSESSENRIQTETATLLPAAEAVHVSAGDQTRRRPREEEPCLPCNVSVVANRGLPSNCKDWTRD